MFTSNEPGVAVKVLEWKLLPCTRCEERKAMPFKMGAGGAYKLRHHDEPGMHEDNVVEVSKQVAARCVYIGDMRWIADVSCAVFKDPKTGEHYAQPVG